MLRVAMWNTNRVPAAHLCSALVHEHNANVLIVLEALEPKATYLDFLNEDGSGRWHLSPGLCERIDMYTRFPQEMSRVEAESKHYTVRSIHLPGFPTVTLVGVHLQSKLHQNEKSQQFEAMSVMKVVRDHEARVGHRRTVITGDFNMDPYEIGMVSTLGFHGLASRRTVQEGHRVVMGDAYDLFFNPMWGHFGDGSARPHGTYRYWSAEHVCQEWHLFDQVLVRPELMNSLPSASVLILETIGKTPLTSSRGVPCVSDHLPLMFGLSIQEVSS